jgi:hypothetical protein
VAEGEATRANERLGFTKNISAPGNEESEEREERESGDGSSEESGDSGSEVISPDEEGTTPAVSGKTKKVWFRDRQLEVLLKKNH